MTDRCGLPRAAETRTPSRLPTTLPTTRRLDRCPRSLASRWRVVALRAHGMTTSRIPIARRLRLRPPSRAPPGRADRRSQRTGESRACLNAGRSTLRASPPRRRPFRRTGAPCPGSFAQTARPDRRAPRVSGAGSSRARSLMRSAAPRDPYCPEACHGRPHAAPTELCPDAVPAHPARSRRPPAQWSRVMSALGMVMRTLQRIVDVYEGGKVAKNALAWITIHSDESGYSWPSQARLAKATGFYRAGHPQGPRGAGGAGLHHAEGAVPTRRDARQRWHPALPRASAPAPRRQPAERRAGGETGIHRNSTTYPPESHSTTTGTGFRTRYT